MKNYFSLDEVIKASIEEAFMNARDMFPVAVVKDDICKKNYGSFFGSQICLC